MMTDRAIDAGSHASQPGSGAALARLSLASSQLLVGTSVVAARYIVEAFPVLLGLAIRQSLATVAMLVVMRLARRGLPSLTPREHLVVFCQSMFGVVLFNVLLMLGVDRTTAAASGIITSAVPAAIALLSLALGERIGRLTGLGIGIAMAGILVVNLAGTNASAAPASAPILGGVLVIGAVFCEAMFTILGKSVAGRIDPLQNCLLVCLYGTALLVPMGLWQLPGFDLQQVPASGWIAIAWSALPVMIGAFFLWFNGLRFVEASTAAVYTGLIPLSALICSFVLLNETIQWQHILGMALVVTAVILVARSPRRGSLA